LSLFQAETPFKEPQNTNQPGKQKTHPTNWQRFIGLLIYF